MPRVLIHFDASSDPVGLWRIKPDDTLESYYLPNVDKKWKKRGEQILEKDKSTYDELFDRLLSSSPYLDHFGQIDAEEDEPLDAVMYRVNQKAVRD